MPVIGITSLSFGWPLLADLALSRPRIHYNARVASRELSLRRPDTCISCKESLDVGARAWWDANLKVVMCLTCHAAVDEVDAATEEGRPASAVEGRTMERGEAGRSSEARYEYLHARREQRIDKRFGRLAGVVKFLTDDPQSTKAWRAGSTGERKLAAALEASVGDVCVLLHDRRVPGTRGNIDHLAVSSNGIWVIDAKNYRGVIQRRDVGGWLSVDNRLFVGGPDRTRVIDGLGWQRDAVREALGGEAPVHAVVCFTDADWGWFTKPFELRDVLVTGPKTLATRIAAPGSLDGEEIQRVAAKLSQALPSK